MVAGLAGRGFAAHLRQALAGIGIGAFGACQPITAVIMDQLLGAQRFFEVFYFLRARQQAGLLAVLRIKVHAVAGNGMAALHVNGLARLQLVSLRQCLLQR